MSDIPLIVAWGTHQDLEDERQFTPDAPKGWWAWNGQSPEREVCQFVRELCVMMQPRLVIETGVGQGYMTRTIAPVLGDHQMLIAYESDDEWRAAMWNLPFWREQHGRVQLSHNPTPLEGDMAAADLCILDSEFKMRFNEIQSWNENAKPGAVALIHDTADRPDTIHQSVRDLIGDLGMTGTFLNNPRGCFLAVQPREA